MQAKLIFTFIRSLLDDSQNDWTPDSYLAPFFNLACRNLQMEVAAFGLVENVAEVILPAVPAGTTSLAAYAEMNQPLSSMWQPLDLYERPAGAGDSAWRLLRRVEVVPPLPPQPFFDFWEYRGGDVVLPPASQPLDLMVRYEALLPYVTETSEPLHLLGGSHILAYSSAALIARSRGAEQLALTLAAESQRQCQLLLLHLNRSRQQISLRQRPYRGNLFASTPRLLS